MQIIHDHRAFPASCLPSLLKYHYYLVVHEVNYLVVHEVNIADRCDCVLVGHCHEAVYLKNINPCATTSMVILLSV